MLLQSKRSAQAVLPTSFLLGYGELVSFSCHKDMVKAFFPSACRLVFKLSDCSLQPLAAPLPTSVVGFAVLVWAGIPFCYELRVKPGL